MRTPANIVRVGPDGAAGEAFGTYPGNEESVFEGLSAGVIFGRALHVHARGDRIAIGNDDAYSVRVHGLDGSLLHIVRLDRAPLTVGADDFEATAEPLRRPGPLQGRMTGALEQMPRHATFPAFGAVELGADGRLWVRDFTPPGGEGEIWHAFDADGTYLARLELPPGMDVLEFGESRILVRARDEMDVERVRLYGLER